MTAPRFTLDAPVASADTWAGRPARGWAREAQIAEEIWRYNMARRDQAAREAQRDDGITPLAEHLVLDCLRALKAISPSPYALELMDMISKGYLQAPEHTVRMRRITALCEISAEEPA